MRAAEPDGAPALLVRRAEPPDRTVLHRLLVDSWIRFWAPHLPTAAETEFRARDPVSRFLDASLQDLEVAEWDGTIMGVIFVDGDRLEDLHVAHRFQGRGVGRFLLRRAERLGARRLEVRAFNDRAIRFYESSGWTRGRTYPTTELGFPVQSHEYVAPIADQDPRQ
ncbi:GNAT family N-acetyltransferase (plasmid) [Peteryoungia desertarenae]|uniref:GNAT family N-acetyltransferase n=1 Tax=Peteryoungia desertarenae TaxID=1813451 RepID=A0ABX6QU19_9HYPH|nr:GNAT family N-acetyltransferase [Peteryoungia desertarenae]QLF71776.1 GNAT family N-acetyltransferase [Peteryoungia desertarenae]